jgi:hypothetical protein
VKDVGLWMIQDGFDPLEMLENVEIRYHQYKQCHKIIKTPESINELKQWLQEVDSENISALPTHGMGFGYQRLIALLKIWA